MSPTEPLASSVPHTTWPPLGAILNRPLKASEGPQPTLGCICPALEVPINQCETRHPEDHASAW